MDEYIDQLLGKPKQPESLTMVLEIMYHLFIQKFFMIDTKSGGIDAEMRTFVLLQCTLCNNCRNSLMEC